MDFATELLGKGKVSPDATTSWTSLAALKLPREVAPLPSSSPPPPPPGLAELTSSSSDDDEGWCCPRLVPTPSTALDSPPGLDTPPGLNSPPGLDSPPGLGSPTSASGFAVGGFAAGGWPLDTALYSGACSPVDAYSAAASVAPPGVWWWPTAPAPSQAPPPIPPQPPRRADSPPSPPAPPPPGAACGAGPPPRAAAPADSGEDAPAKPVVSSGVNPDGSVWVEWAVDAKKLTGADKQAVSPAFNIDLPGHGPTPFKMAAYPIARSDARGGGGFKRAQGKGRVELKCEGQFAEGKAAKVKFFLGIGDKLLAQPLRGPVQHDFAEQSCAGLAKSAEQWEFTKAVDDANKRFIIRLQVQASADDV